MASGATCVQRLDGSRDSAIHTKYRFSLRSSSMQEPRYPLPRIILYHVSKHNSHENRLRCHACALRAKFKFLDAFSAGGLSFGAEENALRRPPPTQSARIVPPEGCKTCKSAGPYGSAHSARIVPPEGCKTCKSAGPYGSAHSARIVPPEGCKTCKSAGPYDSAHSTRIVPPEGCKTCKSAGHNLEKPLVRDTMG
ncbi:hypothetical protein RYX36_009778 [Vicia faba]